MVHLTNANSAFHARVIAARLDAEGIACELHDLTKWPFGIDGEVRVYVREGDLELASELLLFDRVDAVFQTL
jgi:hypothetical protein